MHQGPLHGPKTIWGLDFLNFGNMTNSSPQNQLFIFSKIENLSKIGQNLKIKKKGGSEINLIRRKKFRYQLLDLLSFKFTVKCRFFKKLQFLLSLS